MGTPPTSPHSSHYRHFSPFAHATNSCNSCKRKAPPVLMEAIVDPFAQVGRKNLAHAGGRSCCCVAPYSGWLAIADIAYGSQLCIAAQRRRGAASASVSKGAVAVLVVAGALPQVPLASRPAGVPRDRVGGYRPACLTVPDHDAGPHVEAAPAPKPAGPMRGSCGTGEVRRAAARPAVLLFLLHLPQQPTPRDRGCGRLGRCLCARLLCASGTGGMRRAWKQPHAVPPPLHPQPVLSCRQPGPLRWDHDMAGGWACSARAGRRLPTVEQRWAAVAPVGAGSWRAAPLIGRREALQCRSGLGWQAPHTVWRGAIQRAAAGG